MLKHVVIHDLTEQPQWLHPVVEWHHSEWLAGQEGRPPKDEAEKFAQRVKILESHIGPDAIPTTFIASLHGQPIGSISVVYYQFTKNHSQSEWLTNVYVHNTKRNIGVGAHLLEHACNHARRAGVQNLKLYTRDRDAYYLKRGWSAVSQGRVQGSEVQILQRALIK